MVVVAAFLAPPACGLSAFGSGTRMRVTILGSGTSSGIPVIGCRCPVCTSADPRNQRTRASALVELESGNILIDTSPDLRQQALRWEVARVDAVVFTHAHADHLHGIDELRMYNLWQQGAIPCFANPATAGRIRSYLEYIFDPEDGPGFTPFLDLIEVEGPFACCGCQVIPVPVWHGSLEVLGYRFGAFAYVTDVHRIPDGSMELLKNLDVMVLDALRPKPHPTHFNLEQALAVIARLGPRRAFLTHMSHQVDHATISQQLPAGVELAWDGLRFDVAGP
jgi:phosphoribosyl 1,2-cyclic phosphate phosphodiesterase